MKKTIISLMTLLALACSCQKHEEVFFDTPFATMADDKGGSAMIVDKDANNLMTEVRITLSVSSEKFQEPIQISYEMIAGDGLKEGVDYKIQESTRSPLTFKPGNYTQNIRLIWMKNASFDPSKDGTLKFSLSGSSLDGMVLGAPGPAQYRSSYLFTKQ